MSIVVNTSTVPKYKSKVHKDLESSKAHSSSQNVSQLQSPSVETTLLEDMPNLTSRFDVIKKIGSGTFSNVYLTKVKNSKKNEYYATKYIIPTSHPTRIKNELSCLRQLKGKPNIIDVLLTLREGSHVALIMPYVSHQSFSEYFTLMDCKEIRAYMWNLLIAIEAVHSQHVIHRDIKPSNFLYDRKRKKYALVDFGLAQLENEPWKPIERKDSAGSLKRKREFKENDDEGSPSKNTRFSLTNPNRMGLFNTSNNANRETIRTTPGMKSCRLQAFCGYSRYNEVRHKKPVPNPHPAIEASCKCYKKPQVCRICLNRGRENAPRSGTQGFRPPEVLLRCSKQTTAVDMWSCGVILLCIVCGKYPFFKASDDLSALVEIMMLKGTKEVQHVAESYGKSIICSEMKPAVNLQNLAEGFRAQMKFPNSIFDLLDKFLDLNPSSRLTAKSALKHAFFQTPSSTEIK